MDPKADKLFFQVPRLLWTQATFQAEALGIPLPPANDSLLACVNEWRALQHWPLCTGMLPIAFPICHATVILPEDTRALWQMGLLQQLKGVETSVGVMRRALAPLCEQTDTLLGQIALLMDNFLAQEMFTQYPQASIHCFASFDRLLKHPTDDELIILWEELNFYVTEDLKITDEGKKNLDIRIHHIAKKIADILVVKENTDTVLKKSVLPDYLSLIDGLLFLGEGELAYRVETLYEPLPSKLLNISVPVQKLWAQCLSMSVKKG